VVTFVERALTQRGHHPVVQDAAQENVPFLQGTYASLEKNSSAPPMLPAMQQALTEAQAFVLISGEYNHLPCPGLLNLVNFFLEEYRGKSSALVTYSVGRFGGCRTETALRTLTGALHMPAVGPMLMLSHAHKTLDEGGNILDETTGNTLTKQLNTLCEALETAT
jgi:NAD(P)H-dependent FMN reductase